MAYPLWNPRFATCHGIQIAISDWDIYYIILHPNNYFLKVGKGSLFGHRHGLQNNFNHYLVAIKKLKNTINIYFYETAFQDESTYIAFIFSNSTQKKLFIVKV